jgi:hypothetical protein
MLDAHTLVTPAKLARTRELRELDSARKTLRRLAEI